MQTDNQYFSPIEYLKHYYSVIDRESEIMLAFLAKVQNKYNFNNTTILDFGCGPTIYAIISLSPACASIHMSDYLESNLEQIEWWLKGNERAFNWDRFIQRSLELEKVLQSENAGNINPIPVSQLEIEVRAATIRNKITKLVYGDARKSEPIGVEGTNHYDVLVIAFCLEAIAKDALEWQQLLYNVSTMLKSGGLLIIFLLTESTAYRINEQYFTTTYISEQAFVNALLNVGYMKNSIEIELVDATNPGANSYTGAILATARKC